MNETSLYKTALRSLPECVDVKHYLEVLLKNPENEWFYPTNAVDENFTICRQLSSLGLIAEKRAPQWSNGSFGGFRYEFFYNKEMKFNL